MNAPRVEARRWLRQAQADLEVVRTLASAGHYAAACFFGQQAAEKALKAVLFAHGARVAPEHSVRELARQCEAHAPSFAGLAEEAALLDQFYIPTRDPNGLPAPAVPAETYTEAHARTAEAAATRVVETSETYLRGVAEVLSE